MPDEAPPVVAIVVASDPGPWFEESLAALGNQDYPNLSVLVVDAGSLRNPAGRVARVLPSAFVRRVEQNKGFGATANDALTAVRGASHLLFCHDDVAPAPDAVRRMVEEAYRSNAGVVAPKLVAWNEPSRLLQVGLGADKYASPIARVESGEIDQSQHDEVREVFAAPGGCTLVRADLFETLGGFDEEMSLFGEDVDFSWRAQIAGARVVVAPAARVRHLEATAGGVRRRPDKRTLQRRHELRAVLKNYGFFRRYIVLAQLAVLSVLEAVYAVATGDRERARSIGTAWRWNMRRARHIHRARRAVRKARRLPDRVVCAQQMRSQRLRLFIHAQIHSRGGRAGTRAEHPSLARTQAWIRDRSRGRTEAFIVVAVLIAVLAIGLRGPIAGSLPLVGGFAGFPSATSLLGSLFGGWRSAGETHLTSAPTAFGFLGFGGVIFAGAMGTLQKVLVLGSIALGGIGAGRLMAPFGSTRARLVAAICYLAMPLVWNDFSKGDLQAIVVFAAAPFLFARLARAARFEPFAITCPTGVEMVGFGLLVAIAGSFAPIFFPITVFVTLMVAVGSLVAGKVAGVRRMLAVAGAGCGIAFVMTLPWAVGFLESGARWSVVSGALGLPGDAEGLSKLLRFEIGPMGAGLLGIGTLAAAVFPLVVARGPRLAHATRWWIVALGGFALAWAGSNGWLGAGGGETGALLTVPAVGVSACVALGMVAFEQDLPGFRFGWRQLATVAAAGLAVVGVVPFLAWSLEGRYSLPTIGYEQVLTFIQPATNPGSPGATAGPYRVLWLGQPGALPMTSWQIAPGYAAGLTANGLPDATRLWPSPSPGATNGMIDDVAEATSGRTVNLGHALAKYGVRYIVVPTAAAPVLTGIQSARALPPPPGLVSSLVLQQDLEALPNEGGANVFVNSAWSPADYMAAPAGAASPPLSFLAGGPGAALEIILFLLAAGIMLKRRVRPRSQRGLDPARSSSAGTAPAPRRAAAGHAHRKVEPPPEPSASGVPPPTSDGSSGTADRSGPARDPDLAPIAVVGLQPEVTVQSSDNDRADGAVARSEPVARAEPPEAAEPVQQAPRVELSEPAGLDMPPEPREAAEVVEVASVRPRAARKCPTVAPSSSAPTRSKRATDSPSAKKASAATRSGGTRRRPRESGRAEEGQP
jgi:GT2 family glycosyltransferase